jgi:crotonobetainyl-CoA:carnitine CoA-transferase CaiB-like acyl-CoA transferase
MRHVTGEPRYLPTILAGRTTEDWLVFAARRDIPASRVDRPDELEDDPHLRDVNFFVDAADGAGTSYRFARSPIRLSDSRIEMRPPRSRSQPVQCAVDRRGQDRYVSDARRVDGERVRG